MQIVFILIFFVLSVVTASWLSRESQRSTITGTVMFSFILRLLLHFFVMRSIAFFSHGNAGGDCNAYEDMGNTIATIWHMDGFQYVTTTMMPELRSTSFICNLYAGIIYVCGGASAAACTALVAFLACLLCLVLYRFALTLGASEQSALRVFMITIFSPSFIYHTSDMYKDGMNALLVVSALYIALSTAKQFSVIKFSLLIPVLTALWEVRPYMVFLCLVPLPMALFGGKGTFSPKKVAGFLMLSAVITALVSYGATQSVTAQAETQFSHATDAGARKFNADMGASGVRFEGDTGSPWSAIGPKLVYTVLSPFPWMGGSIGLQFGKIDTLIWYYIIFSTIYAGRWMWSRDRNTLLMLLLFLAVGFLAYATTMSNIGLIFRQRMPLVMITTVLASLYWTHRKQIRSRGSVVREPVVALATGRRLHG
jgi:hypothetical protein